MTRTVLVADPNPVNRILLGFHLTAANYHVRDCDDAGGLWRALASAVPPDLVLLSAGFEKDGADTILRRLRADPAHETRPVLVTGVDAPRRAAALRAGADDALPAPLDSELLLARLRVLWRQAGEIATLEDRAAADIDLGFAEPAAGFAGRARVTLVAPDPAALPIELLRRTLPHLVEACDPAAALRRAAADGHGAGDVFVLCAGTDMADGLRDIVAEIHSRTGPRDTGVLVALTDPRAGQAADMLDRGAADVLIGPLDGEEAALRIDRLVTRQRQVARLHRRIDATAQAARTDALTGLANRRRGLAALRRAVARTAVTGRPVAALMLDLDHFKSINDRHGHAAGDKVLRAVGRTLRRATRDGDLAARIGGEEFLIVLRDTDDMPARAAARRLARAIGRLEIAAPGGQSLRVTASVGVAVAGPDAAGGPVSAQDLLERADGALYRAKAAGRNQVQLQKASA